MTTYSTIINPRKYGTSSVLALTELMKKSVHQMYYHNIQYHIQIGVLNSALVKKTLWVIYAGI